MYQLLKIIFLLIIMESEIQKTLGIPADIAEECAMDLPAIVTKYGYYVETHEVVTIDKYRLKMFRMPRKKGSSSNNLIPVFLMHQFCGSSSDWIVNLPGKGFAYILADAGYDVWLGNARGNYYSKNHLTLSPGNREFWWFTWHEIGIYDLPAMIDYALSKNGRSKLHYIGHSQGTTAFFVMCSMKPQYNDKILSMNALAPVAILANTRNWFIKTFAVFGGIAQEALNAIGMDEFLPRTEIQRALATTFCSEDSFAFFLCRSLFSENGIYTNTSRIAIILSHIPAGVGFKQAAHYSQSVTSGKFMQYDFGQWINSYYYGSPVPPSYNLSLVVAPVAFHISDGDILVNEIDARELYNKLGKPIGMYKLARLTFTHPDYVMAVDAKEQVYDRVISIMKQNE